MLWSIPFVERLSLPQSPVIAPTIDYCELVVYQRDTFLYWVMYPVTLPAYQSHSSLALLADTANLYTANDVRLTLSF